MQQRLGFIGLGIMGRPMVHNLLRAGYRVTVWNRSQAGIDIVSAWGATPAPSAAAVARESDVVITMVGDSADVEQVVLGEEGVLAGARPGLILIDMTTIDPETTRRVGARVAQAGVRMLDAPVSGGERGAQEGTLSIMVGGDADLFEACLPLFQAMGKNIVHVGELGMGHAVKLCNQVICGLNILAVCEGLSLAAKAGVNLDKLLQVVSAGAAGSWMLSNLGPKMAAGDYAPGFMVRLQQKDVRLALAAAERLGLPLPGTALVQQLFRSVQAGGHGHEGTQALIKVFEELGHFRVSGG